MIFGVPFITFVFYYLILIIMIEVALLTVGNTIVALVFKVIRSSMREWVKAYIAYEQYKAKLSIESQEGVDNADKQEGLGRTDNVDATEVR